MVGGKSGLAKVALMELGEVAVKIEDVNNESRNEAKKGGLCRATFSKREVKE